MRLYPDIPARRMATMGRDLVVLLLILLVAWLGVRVHNAVDELAVLGEGVRGAGESVQNALDAAADAIDSTPVVGGELAEGLRGAGEDTGGSVAEAGRRGEEGAHDLALLLGLLVFAIPTVSVLSRYLPERVEEVRRLTAAARVLGEPDSLERRRLLAMRAAFSLPYGELLRFTPDPLGDLGAARYDPLVAAAFHEVGLRAPAGHAR